MKLLVLCLLFVCTVSAINTADRQKNISSKRFLNDLNAKNNITNITDVLKLVSTLTQNLHQMEAKYDQRMNALETLVKTHQKASGATYVRWGRKSCPTNGTVSLYTGYAGGSYYGSSGGAANLLCLPEIPDVTKQVPNAGHIFGTEFYTDFFGPNTQYQDVPCSVCHVIRASSTIMIPGKSDCIPGMSMEYRGYLAVGEDHSPSEYVCVDGKAEYLAGGQSYSGKGRLLFPVASQCGPLPCPPYQNDMVLTCVVCSI